MQKLQYILVIFYKIYNFVPELRTKKGIPRGEFRNLIYRNSHKLKNCRKSNTAVICISYIIKYLTTSGNIPEAGQNIPCTLLYADVQNQGFLREVSVPEAYMGILHVHRQHHREADG